MAKRKAKRSTTKGAPPKHSPEVREAIIDAVAAGVPEKIAAAAAGIVRQTLTRWKQEDAAFSDSIKRARAQSVKVRVERIRNAAVGGQEYTETTTKTGPDGTTETVSTKVILPAWQADAWWLERQFYDEFGLGRGELVKFMREMMKGKESK